MFYLDFNCFHKTKQKTTQQPSTSEVSLTKPRTSPFKKTSPKKKPFRKIKDKQYREWLAQRSKNKPSPEKIGILKKIVHQIKKRNNNSRRKNCSKRNSISISSEKNNPSENQDDDCICIEENSEIILIEDEIPAPINEVKELELKYLKLKQYEAIGKIRLEQAKSGFDTSPNMFTSTPNPRQLKNYSSSTCLFQEDTDPSFNTAVSSTVRDSTDDITIVEDVITSPPDVIVIDDTIVPTTSNSRTQNRIKQLQNDDSVIFVSDNYAALRESNTEPGLIPLDTPSYQVKTPVPLGSPLPTKKSKRGKEKKKRNNLFTTQEEKQLRQYNENAYNPNKDTTNETPKKRMVIIDGSNVAYQYALNKEFSVKGLKICIDYFDKMGHEVKAVVPQYRMQKQKCSQPEELVTLHREGKIVFTPCKNLPGKSSTSYDDRFILQLASELDAAVVSNDNYRDLINENSAFKKIIENRVIGYTWCNDIFILPKDPYGRWGPSLDAILNRS